MYVFSEHLEGSVARNLAGAYLNFFAISFLDVFDNSRSKRENVMSQTCVASDDGAIGGHNPGTLAA